MENLLETYERMETRYLQLAAEVELTSAEQPGMSHTRKSIVPPH